MTEESITADDIERDLDRTRSRLDATLGELERRLAPGSMVEEAVTYFKEGGGMDMARGIGRGMRDNPVPTALIGIGVGWMIFNSARRADRGSHDWARRPWADEGRFGGSHRERYGADVPEHRPMPYEAAARDDLAFRADEAGSALRRHADEAEGAFQERLQEARGAVLGLARRAGEAAESFGDRVEEAMSAAKSRVGAMMHGASDMAGDLADRGQAAARDVYDYGASAASGMRDAGSRTVDYVQDRPLLLGALGITIGAVIGMLVPASRYERRVAGSLRERVGETARDAVADARDRAMRVAEDVVGAARDAGRREGPTTSPPEMASAARESVADAGRRARRVVEETASTGRDAVRREFAGTADPNSRHGAGTRAEQRVG